VCPQFSMFQGATRFNQDLSRWDIRKVEAMDNMFHGATQFKQDLANWIPQFPNDLDCRGMFVGTSCSFQLKESCSAIDEHLCE